MLDNHTKYVWSLNLSECFAFKRLLSQYFVRFDDVFVNRKPEYHFKYSSCNIVTESADKWSIFGKFPRIRWHFSLVVVVTENPWQSSIIWRASGLDIGADYPIRAMGIRSHITYSSLFLSQLYLIRYISRFIGSYKNNTIKLFDKKRTTSMNDAVVLYSIILILPKLLALSFTLDSYDKSKKREIIVIFVCVQWRLVPYTRKMPNIL